ncbi:MAG TPA: penicillin-binding transpeptidase domain-containing protein, partial [Polyangiales bacterium]|nr:penicillin-binding transpeptidase domain-containing protein [Polyangiales bacterium]
MTMLSVRREVGEFRKRYKWMALFVLVSMLALVVRLTQLQIVEHDRWAAEAQRNITKIVRLPATRGLIRDHEGHVIAENRPSYNVYVTPQLLGDDEINLIADLMTLTPAQKQAFRQDVAKVPPRRRSHLVQVFADITRDQYAALETHARELPGTDVVAVPVRSYPFKTLAAHTIGFINEVNADDLKRLSGLGYGPGRFVGRSGVERAWESYLRGKDGEQRSIVDVRGRELDAESRRKAKGTRREPVPGLDLRLTLDMDMMRSVERAFRGHPSGAAVVVDVRTGRVRALFSKPGYDLNEMSGGLSPDRSTEIADNPFRPLIDKTIYESYFPGSTFKPISALAALEDQMLQPTSRFDCPGYY